MNHESMKSTGQQKTIATASTSERPDVRNTAAELFSILNTREGQSKSDGVYGYAAWITTLPAPSSLTARIVRRPYSVIDSGRRLSATNGAIDG